jgi:hypothetical protein
MKSSASKGYYLSGASLLITLGLSLSANAMNQGQGQEQAPAAKGQAGQKVITRTTGEGETNVAHLEEHETRHREHNQTTVLTETHTQEALREEAWSSSDDEKELPVGSARTKQWVDKASNQQAQGKWTKK